MCKQSKPFFAYGLSNCGGGELGLIHLFTHLCKLFWFCTVRILVCFKLASGYSHFNVWFSIIAKFIRIEIRPIQFSTYASQQLRPDRWRNWMNDQLNAYIMRALHWPISGMTCGKRAKISKCLNILTILIWLTSAFFFFLKCRIKI